MSSPSPISTDTDRPVGELATDVTVASANGDGAAEFRRPKRSFTVALIGADGAGKTTVARQVAEHLSFPTAYVYMGSNLEASNWMLPTTWLVRQWHRYRGTSNEGGGPPQRPQERRKSKGLRGWLRFAKSCVSMTHRMAEQAFRHVVTRVLRVIGRVVVFDRHYFTDYYTFAIDPGVNRSWLQRLHGFALKRIFSKPDLVLFLDAPSEVLFARKGEGTIELLDHRRQDYLKVADQFEHFHTVDASQTVDDVIEEVAHRITNFRHCGC